MKLKTSEDREESALLSEISPQDEISPFATLLVFNLEAKPLEKIAKHFGLELKCFSDFNCLQGPQPKSGEHKLQTVDLLAAAICIHENFKFAKMSLNVRHEFLKETRNLESEMREEGQHLPEGYLQVSSACQIYLSQAGIDFSRNPESAVRWSAGEVSKLAQVFFQNAKAAKFARGA